MSSNNVKNRLVVAILNFSRKTFFRNFATPNCRKIDDGNPGNSANTDIYAYSETTFGGPTVGYGMTKT